MNKLLISLSWFHGASAHGQLKSSADYNPTVIISLMDWQTEIHAEFEKAEQARALGNEGQARVCARRAAGIAIREFLTRQGVRPPSVSAYDLLNLLKSDPRLSPDLQLIAEHLTLRVTEEFKLPVNADLIAEARRFCEELLSPNENRP
jgi:hypothetical protein